MKITMCFEATSMAHLKDQLLQAFGSINVGDAVIAKDTIPALDKIAAYPEDILSTNARYGKFATHEEEDAKVGFGPTFTGIDIAADNSDKTVAFAPGPKFTGAPGEIKSNEPEERIDGYVVSNGQVWVPVPGRSTAFTGIPMERYLAQKAAKEAGAELDSKGVPYDATIHTATKLKTQSGEWKKKPVRGSKAEATQPQWQSPVTTQAPPVQIPVTNEPTVAMPFTQFPPAEQAQQTPVIESLAPAIGNAPPMHSYESFKKNLGKITMILANQGKIDRNYLMQLAAHFGVNEIWDIVEPKHEANCRILYNSFIEHGLILGA